MAFDPSRQLRSSEFSHLHVYALHRLANHVEDPPRPKVKTFLKQILEFRGMATPRHCKPLVIPLLAYSGFKQAVKACLLEQISNFKKYLVPFHLPSIQVVAGGSDSTKDVLFNHFYVQKSWSWTAPPKCPCGSLQTHHPNLLLAHGHIASPARLISISRRSREILRFSAASGISPSFQDYRATTSRIVQQWMNTNGLNCYNSEEWDLGSYMLSLLGSLSSSTSSRICGTRSRSCCQRDVHRLPIYVLESCTSHLWRSTSLSFGHHVTCADSAISPTTIKTRMAETILVGTLIIIIIVIASYCLHST